MSTVIAQQLDCSGLSCPMPIVKTAKAIRTMASGELIEVIATDPGSASDFPAWCTSTKNELVTMAEEDGVYRYVIRKR